MGIDGVVKIIKNIFKWIAVFVCATVGYLCVTDYNSTFVGIFWFWTAIVVSPLPRRLRDSLDLKISDKFISNFTWIMAGVAVVLFFFVI